MLAKRFDKVIRIDQRIEHGLAGHITVTMRRLPPHRFQANDGGFYKRAKGLGFRVA